MKFDVPYLGKDNDDYYVNGQGFCCDNAPQNAPMRAPSSNDNPRWRGEGQVVLDAIRERLNQLINADKQPAETVPIDSSLEPVPIKVPLKAEGNNNDTTGGTVQ